MTETRPDRLSAWEVGCLVLAVLNILWGFVGVGWTAWWLGRALGVW